MLEPALTRPVDRLLRISDANTQARDPERRSQDWDAARLAFEREVHRLTRPPRRWWKRERSSPADQLPAIAQDPAQDRPPEATRANGPPGPGLMGPSASIRGGGRRWPGKIIQLIQAPCGPTA